MTNGVMGAGKEDPAMESALESIANVPRDGKGAVPRIRIIE